MSTTLVSTTPDVIAAAGDFKLAGDPTRLRILLFLRESTELHVGAICERLGLAQPVVSHHLSLLRAAGLVEARRSGKQNIYGLTEKGERLAGVAAGA